ncbi:HD domain-containing protein [Mucilaginibacter jinjuensis]|uniref:HD domain-containing protein n=1 Tax=Mucilaginibacter jinjuensis TaxID=1176721 RepID=A0ABY7T1Z5_9SPHI|nr:HD domain-containing protein [Mucilaginibacter jinjuensis]WCT10346.1 HD domain-containing protein [Mucilaginibacter jinjuensis]
MSIAPIVEKAFVYVTDLIVERIDHTMQFHNLQHTLDVFEAAIEISKHAGLNDDEKTIVQLAALFHDTGYVFQYIGHEDNSIAIAGTYLMQQGYHKGMYTPVLECIEATKIPQSPKNLIQEVLCDADFHHFAKPNYIEYAERLRKEWEVHLKRKYTDEEWSQLNIAVLTNHHYFTEYGKTLMQAIKQQNIDLMRNAY